MCVYLDVSVRGSGMDRDTVRVFGTLEGGLFVTHGGYEQYPLHKVSLLTRTALGGKSVTGVLVRVGAKKVAHVTSIEEHTTEGR